MRFDHMWNELEGGWLGWPYTIHRTPYIVHRTLYTTECRWNEQSRIIGTVRLEWMKQQWIIMCILLYSVPHADDGKAHSSDCRLAEKQYQPRSTFIGYGNFNLADRQYMYMYWPNTEWAKEKLCVKFSDKKKSHTKSKKTVLSQQKKSKKKKEECSQWK